MPKNLSVSTSMRSTKSCSHYSPLSASRSQPVQSSRPSHAYSMESSARSCAWQASPTLSQSKAGDHFNSTSRFVIHPFPFPSAHVGIISDDLPLSSFHSPIQYTPSKTHSPTSHSPNLCLSAHLVQARQTSKSRCSSRRSRPCSYSISSASCTTRPPPVAWSRSPSLSGFLRSSRSHQVRFPFPRGILGQEFIAGVVQAL